MRVHSRFYVHTINEYDAGSGTQISGKRVHVQVLQQQNSSLGGDHVDSSIETKQQPTVPNIIKITQTVLLTVAHEVSSSSLIVVP
jgi:hypothetical protein